MDIRTDVYLLRLFSSRDLNNLSVIIFEYTIQSLNFSDNELSTHPKQKILTNNDQDLKYLL
ncbi:hypothetical protein Solca_2358 [Solitalea canadensis DSM 3403]|uniref:Uncharacterized protein n=1 Tax=Solitalea canadensis (strain ATCC 29591 / DSM 3403 / JCM 21819 / LMG 8368 / NBRC 15130 / NCIMB 12057 / USAM 9D) TaxID=929556 RepID=H8KRD3_SOLCM|nr:hypothetical protein Solca_2358 [Solitalea canadensis DSM 3403]